MSAEKLKKEEYNERKFNVGRLFEKKGMINMSQIVLKNGDCLDIMDELIKQNVNYHEAKDFVASRKLKA